MKDALYTLIVLFVLGGVIYWASAKFIADPFILKVAQFIAGLLILVGLVNFLFFIFGLPPFLGTHVQ